MKVLRIRLDAPPANGRPAAWALFDADGTRLQNGFDAPDAWPDADRVEYVLAASQVRSASLALPPMPASRLAGAVGFALEDQLAEPLAGQHLAISTPAPDGRVRVAIVARSVLTALSAQRPASRIIAEPDLAQPLPGWRWCGREGDGAGFVRRADGSAFSVDAIGVAGSLPAEIAVAIAQSRRDKTTPDSVRVDAAIDEAALVRWRQETGLPFEPGTPWQWQDAPPEAFAHAIDLIPAAAAQTTSGPPYGVGRLFVPALVLAGIAITLHVIATLVDWGTLRFDAWRSDREWLSLATASGIPPTPAMAPQAARTALAQRYAELRHARGLPVPNDALPLLARAAPALAMLPPGTVKSATYADGSWTLELAKSDPTIASDLDMRMRREGLPALLATSQGGTRLRFGGGW